MLLKQGANSVGEERVGGIWDDRVLDGMASFENSRSFRMVQSWAVTRSCGES